MQHNWHNDQKALARHYLLDVAGPKRLMIFLPGWNPNARGGLGDGCEDIKLARQRGLINRSTRIIAVERDPVFADAIELKLHAMGLGPQVHMHRGELHTLRFGEFDRVDFAFLDFLGAIDKNTAIWMHEYLRPRLAVGADISFTFNMAERNNWFDKRSFKAFRDIYVNERRMIYNRYDMFDNSRVLVYLLIVITLLRDYGFCYHPAYVYKGDGNQQSMVGLRLTDVRPHASAMPWPTLYDVLAIPMPRNLPRGHDRLTFGAPLPPRLAMPARSAAALKAWATRRANGWVHPARKVSLHLPRPASAR